MADDFKPAAWWLAGNFAPVTKETESFDLKIEGALPPELNGVFMRNGPNPDRAPTAHWFMGDGMLHGLRLEGGKAKWYRNRFTQTERRAFTGDARGPENILNRRLSSANTALVRHAGKIYALEEAHFPYEVDGELNTVGCQDFGGKLTSPMTAHPKVCPETGEMMSFGYSFMPPWLTYHRFDAKGALVQTEEIPVTGPTMIHDFAMTRKHVIFMDLPIVFDIQMAMSGSMPFKWSDDYPARMGIMPRAGSVADLNWFDVKACYIFHTLNAFDDGDTVVMDAARYDRMWSKGFADAPGLMSRYVFNLKTGKVSETQLDGQRACDFPRVPDDRLGLKHRYAYATATGEPAGDDVVFGTQVFKWDLQTGAAQACDFGDGRHPGEAVFARAGKDEDAGYLLSIVHDDNTNVSEFVVIDAQKVSKGPIARIALPQRVPYGFHGAWFEGA